MTTTATTTTKTNGTNGTAKADDGGSVLDKLNAEFVRDHKGKTSQKRVKELVSNYLNATKRRAEAEAAIEAAVKAESDAATALIREACGKNKVTIGGVLYSPMSRGERVFFRKESGEAIELG